MDVRRRLVFLVAPASLLLGVCSPLDQAAVTRDEATEQPALQVALCDGETVSAVTLPTHAERDGYVVDSRTLWKITASEPSMRTYFVVGETPDGFAESVRLAPLPNSDHLSLDVSTSGGARGFHGESFRVESLESRVLVNGDVTTVKALRRAAAENCSFLGLVLPAWAPWAGLAAVMFFVVGSVAVAVVRTRKDPEVPPRL